MWWVLGGALVFIAGSAMLAPKLIAVLCNRFETGTVGAPTLAARLISEDWRQWRRCVTALSMVFGIVFSTFIFASASVAFMLPYTASPVPQGVTMLQTHHSEFGDLPQSVQSQFEKDVGLSDNPTEIVTESLILPEQGLILSWESLDELEAAVGQLTAEQRAVLEDGGVLSPYATSDSDTQLLLLDGNEATVRVVRYTPAATARYRVGGFSLTKAIPKKYRETDNSFFQFRIYLGLTPAQDELARSWPEETGQTAVDVSAYHPTAEFYLPLTAGMSLAGFGLLVCPVVWMLLAREARSLRPVLARLTDLGVSANWGKRVLRWMAMPVIGITTGVAALSGIAYLAVLLVVYQGEAFDPWGIPWWVLAMFITGLAAGTWAGVGLAARRLHHSETAAIL
jgi:hypothetical protein